MSPRAPNPADEIPEPCDADWEAMPTEDGGRRRRCAACQTRVWDLSAMSEGEANAFLDATRGEAICMAVTLDADGEAVYRRPEAIVPAGRLSRVGRAATRRAAPTLIAAALAACTPHGSSEPMPELDDAPSLEDRLAAGARIPLLRDPGRPGDQGVSTSAQPVLEPLDAPPRRRVGRRPVQRVKKGTRRRPDPLTSLDGVAALGHDGEASHDGRGD